MKKLLLYTVLNEIYKIKKKGKIKEEQFSNLLIELDKAGFTLTPVIESLNGLCTPYLKYRLDELVIFNILNQSSLVLTKEGLDYVSKEIEQIYQDPRYKTFLKTAKALIEKVMK